MNQSWLMKFLFYRLPLNSEIWSISIENEFISQMNHTTQGQSCYNHTLKCYCTSQHIYSLFHYFNHSRPAFKFRVFLTCVNLAMSESTECMFTKFSEISKAATKTWNNANSNWTTSMSHIWVLQFVTCQHNYIWAYGTKCVHLNLYLNWSPLLAKHRIP